MTTQCNYILTPDNLTLIKGGDRVQISRSNPCFSEILKMLREREYDKIFDLCKFDRRINQYTNNQLYVDGDIVYYKGNEIHNKLVDRIVQFMNNGLDFMPLMKFLQNQLKNPSQDAVDGLYDFIEHGNMPITEDGCFLAYKYVDQDYLDSYSRTFDNSIGKVVEMNRDDVDPNRDVSCSPGLHVCTFDYVSSNMDSNKHCMIVKVNPEDVVSVPFDYDAAKMRCCKYTVVDEYEDFKHNEEFFDDIFSDKYEDEEEDFEVDDLDEDNLPYSVTVGEVYEATKYINDAIRKGTKVRVIETNFDFSAVYVKRGKRGDRIYKVEMDKFLENTKLSSF